MHRRGTVLLPSIRGTPSPPLSIPVDLRGMRDSDPGGGPEVPNPAAADRDDVGAVTGTALWPWSSLAV